MQSWIKKYEPKSAEEIIGQDAGLKQIDVFIQRYKEQKKKALLLYGPSGVGKTISAHAIAGNYEYETVEVNASDFRSKKQIEDRIGNALGQQSLFSKGKIILIDEIDGLSGTKDRGGMQAIVKLIQKSSFPIILTACNPYEQKFSSLRNKCMLVQFQALSYTSIFKVLKEICDVEGVKYTEMALKALSRRCGGDLRAAINDLQTYGQSSMEFGKEQLSLLEERNQIESMPNALVKIFKNSDINIALSAFDNVNEDIDKIFLWIDENLPKEYEKEDLSRAYGCVSKADVFKGRIRRWQHWRFLSYINQLLTAGVAASKKERKKEFVKYTPTNRILKIWQANMKYAKRKSISEKVAQSTHTSKRRVMRDILPFIHPLLKDNKRNKELIEEFEFDKDEIKWLGK